MPALVNSAAIKKRLMENFKRYIDWLDGEFDKFVYVMVSSDYFSRGVHNGGLVGFDQKHFRCSDGKEHTINDVPLDRMLEDIERYIEDHVPSDRRIEVFEKVTAAVPGFSKTPDWEKPIVNPHENPETPFSASKADDGKSNAQLLRDFALAASIEPSEMSFISAQIVFNDASGDDSRPPILSMSLKEGAGVRGGRLGRDHTLADVPHHFVRDRLIDYIAEFIPAERRADVRKSVFSDLTPSQVEEYAALIAKKKADEEAKEIAEAEEEERKLRKIGDISKVQNPNELENIYQQLETLEAINEDIDITPQENFAFRDDEKVEPIFNSVIQPNSRSLPSEANLGFPNRIDKDCDQVRAMVKRFVFNSEWTLDEFRRALGGVTRPQLTKFLEKRGPKEGVRTACYQLAWEFFKKRDSLGLSNGAVLQESDANRGNKRPNDGDEVDSPQAKRNKEAV